MKQLRIITVGKIKTPHWHTAAQHYITRICHNMRCHITAVKDGQAKFAPPQRMAEEAQNIQKVLRPQDTVICLDEKGKHYTSVEFSALLQKLWDTGKQPAFIVGGAFGIDPAIKQQAQYLIALGPMTLPHELAQVVLLEQIYRAEAIASGSQYHHE